MRFRGILLVVACCCSFTKSFWHTPPAGKRRISPAKGSIYTVMPGHFDFVHPTIAEVLACPEIAKPRELRYLSLDRDDNGDLLRISLQFPENAEMEDLLVVLAHECHEWIYSNEEWLGSFGRSEREQRPDYWLALSEFARDEEASSSNNSSNVMIATLLALNGLESAIRNATGYTTGKAPLFKTMINELTCPKMNHVCSLLLTPHGLNLRNLLWHGFITNLPRPWLSLVLVLTQLVVRKDGSERNDNANHTNTTLIMNVREVPEFDRLLEHARVWRDDPPSLMRSNQPWLPPLHHALYEAWVLPWLKSRQRPATCCALLSILLEHGLRMDWCHANDRLDDRIARPHTFFVTLDGHGQRQIHDLLLHPYVTAGSSSKEDALLRNALIAQAELPASTLALLTDLFCSSYGGPNIRAAVSHGLWDELLEEEWTESWSKNENKDQKDHGTQDRLWDMIQLILFAMDSVATRSPIPDYLPVFSYTAVTRRALWDCQTYLQELVGMTNPKETAEETDPDVTYCASELSGSVPAELLALQRGYDVLAIQEPLLQRIECWEMECVYEEHEMNLRLADAGLTISLLHDVAAASQQLLHDVRDACSYLDSHASANKRKQKSWLRMVGPSRDIGITLYTLALNVAILSLRTEQEEDATMTKALQRTRMVVSTSQNFLKDKVDRATKSILEYTKGKAIQQVAARIQSAKDEQDRTG